MTTSRPLVSVIIPVYNVRKYIDSCITSVVNQSYKKLEIILVDDGSQDESGARCDYWQKKDDRIKTIHKDNDGLNMARFSGFQLATGDYIMFLDSDDKLHPDAIKNTITIAQEENLDAVMFQFLEFSDEEEQRGVLSPLLHSACDRFTSPKDALRLLITNNYQHFFAMTAWGKLYAKRLIEAVDWRQSNFRAFEDNFFTPQIFDNIHQFAIIHQQLYFYRRNDSATNALSKTTTGNTLNGKPVGHLEYLCLLRDYWRKLLNKHHIDLEEDLQEFWLGSMLTRLEHLVGTQSLCKENNAQFIPQLVDYLLIRHNRDTGRKQEEIDRLTIRVTELEQTSVELAELKTVRGSIRNATSQVKRRLTKKPS